MALSLLLWAALSVKGDEPVRPAVTIPPDPTAPASATVEPSNTFADADLAVVPREISDTRALAQEERAQKPIWKFWITEARSDNPVEFLEPDVTYDIYLKLSKLNDGRSRFYEASDLCVERLLRASETEKVVRASVLALPDQSTFDRISMPRGDTTISASLLRRNFANLDEVRAVEKDTRGLRGNGQPIEIHVREGAQQGGAAITFLVMLQDAVLEELVLPVCIGVSCDVATPLQSRLRADAVNVTEQAAALTFVDTNDGYTTGIFWQPEGPNGTYNVWRIKLPTQVDQWIADTEGMLRQDYSTAAVGRRVLGHLFPGKVGCVVEQPCRNARIAFQRWLESAVDKEGSKASLVVRLLSPSRPPSAPRFLPLSYVTLPEPVISSSTAEPFPMNAASTTHVTPADPTAADAPPAHELPRVAVPAFARFLGEHVFVYVPGLSAVDRSKPCVSRWWLVGPSPVDEDTKGAHQKLRASIDAWSKLPPPVRIESDSSLNALKRDEQIDGLIVISHFDAKGFRAKESEDFTNKVMDTDINISFRDPGFAALLACETGLASRLLEVMIEKGAKTIIATPPVVNAVAVGEFVRCFEAQVPPTGTTVRNAFRGAMECMAKNSNREAALRFAVVGDPDLQLCGPGE
ncbi:MAG TPA: hypothetical protein VMU84_03565, partial [Thermoanaerobaculia bacterium]|nr:hypothetical protein [Thermoanaerobaculia bacterium]